MNTRRPEHELTLPISVVIPMLNEAATLGELLEGLKAQTARPAELIFVDAGSTDGSKTLVEDWWKKEGWAGGECRVMERPGAFPGAGRNTGIGAAKNQWIAFIDVGIVPDQDWLKFLFEYAVGHKVEAVFGICKFEAAQAFEKAVCALSYGCGSAHPVIPASLFHRKVFTLAGLFPSNLRSAEDLWWMKAFLEVYKDKHICSDAVVYYRHFPQTVRSALNKWYIYEKNATRAGTNNRLRKIYLLVFSGLLLLFFLNIKAGLFFLSCYILFRGLFDTGRRSADWLWWRNSAVSLFYSTFLGVLLDTAKVCGYLAGSLQPKLNIERT